MKGELQFLWEKERKVQIDDIIYNLAPHIITKYFKVGNVSFSLDKENNQIISFIKNDEVVKPNQGISKPIETPKPPILERSQPKADAIKLIPEIKTFEQKRQDSIKAQYSIREALRVIEINNSLENSEKLTPTRKNILETAEIILNLIGILENRG